MENKNTKKQNDDCPLCEVSDEAIDKLRLSNNPNVKGKSHSKARDKEVFWKLGAVIAVPTIFLGVFAFSLISQSTGKNAPVPRQSAKIVLDAPKIGSIAPDFTLEDINGKKVSLSSFRNKKPVLLAFWATWCGYCAKELPDLKNFTKEHRNKIQVIAIPSGEVKSTVKKYVQEKEINFLMLLDETRKTWNRYLIRGTPSHILIDKAGKIVTMRPGIASKRDLEVMFSMVP